MVYKHISLILPNQRIIMSGLFVQLAHKARKNQEYSMSSSPLFLFFFFTYTANDYLSPTILTRYTLLNSY